MTESSLLGRMRALVPTLRERAADTEKAGRVLESSIRDLVDAGMFRAWVPRAFGGDELALEPVFEAGVLAGTGCTATAWVAMLCASHSVMATWYGAEAQAEVWARGADAIIASSFAPMGRCKALPGGGYELSGRWKFSSGVDHASWAILGAMIEEPGQDPRSVLLLVPASDYSIVADWRVSGLKGTGSNSVTVDRAFVPEHRVETMRAIGTGTPRGITESPKSPYILPWRGFFSYTFVPAAIGTARAALDRFRTDAKARRDAYTGAAFKERSVALTSLAASSFDVDAAHQMMTRDLAGLKDCGADPIASARFAYHASSVVGLSSQAVVRLYRQSGASALYDDAPMQRYLRDMLAITQHPAIDPSTMGEAFGKALLESPVT